MNSAQQYRVEGHGASILMVEGGRLASWGFHRQPLLTREGAWSTVKAYMGKDLHTIKVFCGGKLVFRAFKNVDGNWYDAETALAVAS